MSRSHNEKPLAIALLQGGHANPFDVLAPIVEEMDPPEHMSEVAQELWREVLPVLAEVGLLTTLDVVALAQLCESYADWVAADHELEVNNGGSSWYRTVDAQGNTIHRTHPAYEARKAADGQLMSWLREFGMTPAARARWRTSRQAVTPDSLQQAPGDDIDVSQLSQGERDALRSMIERRRAVSDRAAAS